MQKFGLVHFIASLLTMSARMTPGSHDDISFAVVSEDCAAGSSCL